jgi:hypothetical protein
MDIATGKAVEKHFEIFSKSATNALLKNNMEDRFIQDFYFPRMKRTFLSQDDQTFYPKQWMLKSK